MWDWGEANGFDVNTGSTQNMYPQYAFNSDWVEHCIPLLKCHARNNFCDKYIREWEVSHEIHENNNYIAKICSYIVYMVFAHALDMRHIDYTYSFWFCILHFATYDY